MDLDHRRGPGETRDMTAETAALAISLALMGGYYWARWRRAENSRRVAKAAVDTAEKGAWRARGMVLLVGIAVYAAIDLWLRGRGR